MPNLPHRLDAFSVFLLDSLGVLLLSCPCLALVSPLSRPCLSRVSPLSRGVSPLSRPCLAVSRGVLRCLAVSRPCLAHVLRRLAEQASLSFPCEWTASAVVVFSVFGFLQRSVMKELFALA